MNKREIIRQIEKLTEEAYNSGNKAAAGVLLSLSGSMLLGKETELLEHLESFNEKQIQNAINEQTKKN